ncbi:MAG: RlmE family RNA methyltransferase [Candidatus Gracilibacteria bacterium]|nr:RlmE family RNA methyltransferase [Candidatus Gracilibacteria bacterium]
MEKQRKKRPTPFIIHDEYFFKAKKEGYRARSAFKLIELQEKFSLIKAGMKVCDVASAPGSFLQVIRKNVGNDGLVVGIDLQKIDNFGQENIHTIQHDIYEFDTLKPKVEAIIGEGKLFDLVTSDIAPKTTGRADIDQYESVELNIGIVKFADVFLKKGGNLVLKVFIGEDFNDLLKEIKLRYKKLSVYKPFACRDRSPEEYVVCFDKLN